MALKKRLLKVTLTLQDGKVVVLDQELDLHIRIAKAALAIQNRATIEVVGLTQQLREELLSQFTAWRRRQVLTAQIASTLVKVKIEAGYSSNGAEQTSVVFIGEVAICEPASPPPNIGIRITAFSRQIDKTNFVTDPAPSQTTYAGYVEWAANQMGFGKNFVCETSFNDVTIQNPARSILTQSALLVDIQNMYRPDVAAFIDDDFLIVKDRNKIIHPEQIANLNEFVGIPSWTEWGISAAIMLDQAVKLAGAIQLTSLMNPSVNGKYVVMELEYDLTSRDRAFYVKIGASPPA